jgi:hypothetical protein
MIIMDRIKYIEEFCDKERIGDNSVLYALIRCLDVNDAVKILKRSFSGNLLLRDASLKIVLEHSSKLWAEIYDRLITDIINKFKKLSPKHRGRAFYCLGELAQFAPSKTREVILHFLLTSRYVAGRRKGLSIIDPAEISYFNKEIENCAFTHGDVKAGLILIQHYEPAYLYENRRNILKILDAGWAVGKLYLRAAEHAPACIDELRHIDGVTFAYAKAKLNQTLSSDEIMSLIEEFRYDERLGLLVWSIGKMKHWDVLLYVADHYERWQTERVLEKLPISTV